MSKSSELLARCTFPPLDTAVTCAFSGGPDSTALIALARAAGLDVTAHHVDHRLRDESADEAQLAVAIAEQLDVPVIVDVVAVEPGPNLEARARAARRSALPADAMTGHTADDQAETVLLRLLRGSAGTGLGAMRPGWRHPILALRRTETEGLCRTLGIEPVRDPSNHRVEIVRNRVRSQLLPLADDIARRDLVPILTRTADLLRDDSDYLDELAATLDPTDTRAIREAPAVLARRALRAWLAECGYAPDAAAIERVMAVAHGRTIACELPGGRRVARSGQRLSVAAPAPTSRTDSPHLS